MINTVISCITTDITTQNQLLTKINTSPFPLGIKTTSFSKFIHFAKQNQSVKHILFYQPYSHSYDFISPLNLKKYADIYTVLITSQTQKGFSLMIQRFGFHGLITKDGLYHFDLHQNVTSLLEFGFLKNAIRSEKQWVTEKSNVVPTIMPPFTTRQIEVIYLMTHGYDGNGIAKKLSTSTSNIRNIISAIKDILNCTTEKQIITICLANFWVTIHPNKFVCTHQFLKSN